MDNLYQFIKFKFAFIIYILLSLAKSEIVVENITFSNENITMINDINETNKYYIFRPDKNQILPNYIKIIVEDKDKDISFNDYIILYYKNDSTFTERKQLSQTSSTVATMWLTKDEISNDFYISVECTKNISNLNYFIKIIPSEKIEIKIGEIYTYYVSEEKKNLTFNIENFPKNNSEKIVMTIWAKGYKSINSTLLGGNYEKHEKFSAYSIELPILNDNEYNLTVEGTIGDLIDVGALVFKDQTLYKNKHKICQNETLINWIEYSGFLKRGIIDENCFITHDSGLTYYNRFTFKDNEELNIMISNISRIETQEENGRITCITLPSGIHEVFYSFQVRKEFYYSQSNDYNKLYPALLGGFVKNIIHSNGFFPRMLEDNSNYLTFNVYTTEKLENSPFILICDTYPSCSLDNNNTNKIIPLKYYSTIYSISFNKSELIGDFNPIGKNKKILVIPKNDYIKFSIYTDKTLIMPTDLALQYNYIRKGCEDNLLLTRIEGYINSYKHYYFINIEIISGNISLINFNNKIEYYSYKNMHLFKSRENKFVFLSLKIKAEKNSVYCIKYYHLSDNELNQNIYSYLMGSNFLFNIYLKSIKMLSFVPTYMWEKYTLDDIAIYLNVILINCTTDDFLTFNRTYFHPYQYSNLNYSFYQLIMEPDADKNPYNKFFTLFPSLGNSCFIYVSNNYFPTNYSDSYEYIQILEENFPKAVVFNQTYNKYFFAFFFGETDKDMKIKFYPLNNGKFELTLFINDLELEKKYDIKKKGNIKLNNSSWKDICEDEKQMCK